MTIQIKALVQYCRVFNSDYNNAAKVGSNFSNFSYIGTHSLRIQLAACHRFGSSLCPSEIKKCKVYLQYSSAELRCARVIAWLLVKFDSIAFQTKAVKLQYFPHAVVSAFYYAVQSRFAFDKTPKVLPFK